MDRQEILKHVDHTQLAQTAGWDAIQTLCDEAISYGTASVCIPPSFVKQAREYVGDKMAVCTVIGFPNGYTTTAVKVFETEQAVCEGADEIDMVLNIGALKDGNDELVQKDIEAVVEAVSGKCIKVILETCLLNKDEIVRACKLCMNAKADFVKTSTGFSTSGATVEDVKLMKDTVKDQCKVKAAGGVRTFADMEAMIAAGADRIGTSKGIQLLDQD